MAISALEYSFLSAIAQKNVFPTKPSVLEFGEQHWHGDISIDVLSNIINQVENGSRKKNLINALTAISELEGKKKNFGLAKVAYQLLLDYSTISAIDLHGTDEAFKFDLNEPVPIDQSFDVTINLGTGEHVFNVYQFFKTVHDLTSPGGIMIHAMPFLGWIDHGFFNFQPTFYWDLAQYNDYQIISFMLQPNLNSLVEFSDRAGIIRYIQKLASEGHYVNSSNLYAVFKKNNTTSQPFRIPMQSFFQISREDYWSAIIDIPLRNEVISDLNLREINLIIFPDWSQPEELFISIISEVITAIAQHPDREKITLLVDFTSFPKSPEADPNLVLSTIEMNLLLEQNLDVSSSGLGISLIQELNAKEWESLLQQVRYRISIPRENSKMIATLGIDKVESSSLDHIVSRQF